MKESDDQKLDTFDFDIFGIDRLEKHRLIWTMWKKLNLFEKYNIKMDIYKAMLLRTETLYNQYGNPYHNYDHALNGIFYNIIFLIFLVLHCVYYFIQKTSFMKQ
jgi:hypothetical protein